MRIYRIALVLLVVVFLFGACADSVTGSGGPNCSKGKACGKTCIEKTDTCHL